MFLKQIGFQPIRMFGKSKKIELWENYKKILPKAKKKTLEINRLSYLS